MEIEPVDLQGDKQVVGNRRLVIRRRGSRRCQRVELCTEAREQVRFLGEQKLLMIFLAVRRTIAFFISSPRSVAAFRSH